MRALFVTVVLVLPSTLDAQSNPRFTFSIDGPCGETLLGSPGSAYDDSTGGADYFFDLEKFTSEFVEVPNNRPGHTWDVVLTTSESPDDWHAAWLWLWSLGLDGPISITDITTSGTPSCRGGLFRRGPECIRFPGGFETSEITGPPEGAGPQTEENRGVLSGVALKSDGLIALPNEGSSVIEKIRVFAEFPSVPGDVERARLYFTTRTGSSGVPFAPLVGDRFSRPTLDEGDPPLEVEDCEVFFKAATSGAFLRCDPNSDGRSDISDAVWVFQELFRGGPSTACPESADCNADGMRDVTDAVYALSYQFTGGPPPPAPYPGCGFVDGLAEEDCPFGSSRCE